MVVILMGQCCKNVNVKCKNNMSCTIEKTTVIIISVKLKKLQSYVS